MGYFFIIVGEDRLVGFVTSNKSSEIKIEPSFSVNEKNTQLSVKYIRYPACHRHVFKGT